jgi:chaperonin cofactor prefoldin
MHWKDNIIRQDPKEKLSELKRKVKQLDMSINNLKDQRNFFQTQIDYLESLDENQLKMNI